MIHTAGEKEEALYLPVMHRPREEQRSAPAYLVLTHTSRYLYMDRSDYHNMCLELRIGQASTIGNPLTSDTYLHRAQTLHSS